MAKAIDQSAIFAAIKQGVIAALNDHHKMSGEYNVGGIPESYFQIKVADSLAAMGGYKITLEDTYWRILEEAKANPKAIKSLKKPHERADIIIRWGENRSPRMIVEMKRAIHGRALARDAVKIGEALKHESCLEGGILVGLFRKNPTVDTIQEKTERFTERKEVTAKKHDFVNIEYGKNKFGESIYAGAGIFEI